MTERYTVTMFVAAPGTPLKSGGTSSAGHVYYVVSDGEKKTSYGFAPSEHGASSGPGKVYLEDLDNYLNPLYQRKLEITESQFNKLKEFGENPEKHGFSMEYRGATNSCIDFMWGGLNHAGIHRNNLLKRPDTDFEGTLKPLDNIKHIKSIPAPVPGSPENTEKDGTMPKRTMLQYLISEETLPEGQRSMLNAIRDQVAGIDQKHGRVYDPTSERISVGLLASAREQGMERVDHVVLGNAPTDGSAQRMFAVQGALNDPSHCRASVSINEAVQTPVDRSFERLQAAEQAHQQREALAMSDPHQAQSPSGMRMG
ncbi:XVIPCD domain-containing protein [Stenotrophomonas sp. 278]|uniref:XVIPCD domain-containing protein n=1 Tax=Stenotrophomonas sp. 278 TaxID=2479851 RepID=UPI000F67247B|nr:XVIPCD domain-containing protein [Stenotrophomonas sp. 278]RRU04356.1 hypothetical protein EGJ34_18810 [Stenotrophomonas sp. 278]